MALFGVFYIEYYIKNKGFFLTMKHFLRPVLSEALL